MNKLKLAVSIFVITSFAACASVTDANLDSHDAAEEQTAEISDKNENDAEEDDIWYNSNGDDMDPIVDRPPSPRGN